MARKRTAFPPANPKTRPGAWPKSPTPPRILPLKRIPRARASPSSPLPPRAKHIERINKSHNRWLDTIDGTTYAVKRISNGNQATESSMRSLQRLLRWEHLVNIYDFENFQKKGDPIRDMRLVYWDYCDQGTVADLIYANQDGVPESMIWHTISSLLHATLWLHEGIKWREYGRTTREKRWQPMVHNAINPNTIFLKTARNPTDHPRVKLGYFKRAIFLPSRAYMTDHLDFQGACGDELTGFEAPELIMIRREEDPEDESNPIGCRSDLWSIAAVAVAMMGSIGINAEPKWNNKASRTTVHKWKRLQLKSVDRMFWEAEELPGTYSSQLKGFIASLLWIDPICRLDTQDALEQFIDWRREWLQNREPSDDEYYVYEDETGDLAME